MGPEGMGRVRKGERAGLEGEGRVQEGGEGPQGRSGRSRGWGGSRGDGRVQREICWDRKEIGWVWRGQDGREGNRAGP